MTDKYPEDKTRMLAQLLGCAESNSKEIIKFLKNQDTSAVHSQIFNTMTADDKRGGLPIPFKPAIQIESVIYR